MGDGVRAAVFIISVGGVGDIGGDQRSASTALRMTTEVR